MGKRVLIVDLNNFARYPSIAIGYLIAILRLGGFDVDLLAPLAVGLSGVPREMPPPRWGWIDLRFRYLTAVSRNRLVRTLSSAVPQPMGSGDFESPDDYKNEALPRGAGV